MLNSETNGIEFDDDLRTKKVLEDLQRNDEAISNFFKARRLNEPGQNNAPKDPRDEEHTEVI